VILYTNGCSHTYGCPRALDKQQWGVSDKFRKKTWGAKLAKILGADWSDSSLSGNNNKLMCSDILHDLYNPILKPSYAVIQFTYPTRFWTPYATHGEHAIPVIERNYNTNHDRPFFGKNHQPNGSWPKEESRFVAKPYDGLTKADKAFCDQYFEGRGAIAACTIHMMAEIKQIELALNDREIPYTFIIWPQIFHEAYNDVSDSIDKSRVLNYDSGEYFNMDKLLPSHGHKYPKGSAHLQEPGQQFLAEAVYKHMIASTKLVPKGRLVEAETFIDTMY